MIVYFTGTGNSRFVADMLAHLTNDKAVSANEIIKEGRRAKLESKDPWTFVCPVYVSAPPRVFSDFIKCGYFSGSRDVRFIVTAAGSSVCACPYYFKELCTERSFNYLGTANVQMPQNYLVFFKTKEKNEADIIVEESKAKISELAQYINNGEPFPEAPTSNFDVITTKMVIDPYYKWFMGTKKFYAGEKCIGCGKCVGTCPLNNIKLIDKKPVWGNNCTHCVACINLCPTKAIEYGKATKDKPRYSCIKFKPE